MLQRKTDRILRTILNTFQNIDIMDDDVEK